MKKVRRENTGAESAIRSELYKLDLRYRVHAKVLESERFKPDIVFKKARVAVFIDGCFWHACPLHASWPKINCDWWQKKILANVDRDRRIDKKLKDAGWIVIRIWEHENPKIASKRIAKAVISSTI
jgi:DNA mismatch endonuclease (patch repair protein)